MSRSLNRPIKTQVSAGSEPPYREQSTFKPDVCVDVQPRKRTKTLADDAACIPPAPTTLLQSARERSPAAAYVLPSTRRKSVSVDGRDHPTTSLPSGTPPAAAWSRRDRWFVARAATSPTLLLLPSWMPEEKSGSGTQRPIRMPVVREASIELMIERSLSSSRGAHAAHGAACLDRQRWAVTDGRGAPARNHQLILAARQML